MTEQDKSTTQRVDPVPAVTPRWLRRPWLVGGVALLVGLVAGGGIAAAVLGPEAGPRIGTLLPAADGEVDEAAAITVELPAESVTFSVSNPVDEVATAPEIDTPREAGPGTSLLGVGWSFELGSLPLGPSVPLTRASSPLQHWSLTAPASTWATSGSLVS